MDGSVVLTRWRQCAPPSKACFIASTRVISQTACLSVQQFCRSGCRRVDWRGHVADVITYVRKVTYAVRQARRISPWNVYIARHAQIDTLSSEHLQFPALTSSYIWRVNAALCYIEPQRSYGIFYWTVGTLFHQAQNLILFSTAALLKFLCTSPPTMLRNCPRPVMSA